ncbi:Uncharacterised protein [Candidatus Tiddalikarchaeum anstoanum]|nr:Uncharacterised protein [Candidatus Tiddalikarchaeum anstoanum]
MEQVIVRIGESKYFEKGSELTITGLNGCTGVILSGENCGIAIHFYSNKTKSMFSEACCIIKEKNLNSLSKCLVIYSKNDTSKINEYLNSLGEELKKIIPEKNASFRVLYYKSVANMDDILLRLSSNPSSHFSEVKITERGELLVNLEKLRIKTGYDAIFTKTQEELDIMISYANTHTNLRF